MEQAPLGFSVASVTTVAAEVGADMDSAVASAVDTLVPRACGISVGMKSGVMVLVGMAVGKVGAGVVGNGLGVDVGTSCVAVGVGVSCTLWTLLLAPGLGVPVPRRRPPSN